MFAGEFFKVLQIVKVILTIAFKGPKLFPGN
jgi:hypothetical protein